MNIRNNRRNMKCIHISRIQEWETNGGITIIYEERTQHRRIPKSLVEHKKKHFLFGLPINEYGKCAVSLFHSLLFFGGESFLDWVLLLCLVVVVVAGLLGKKRVIPETARCSKNSVERNQAEKPPVIL